MKINFHQSYKMLIGSSTHFTNGIKSIMNTTTMYSNGSGTGDGWGVVVVMKTFMVRIHELKESGGLPCEATIENVFGKGEN